MRLKCLAQEHDAVPWPGLEPGLLNLESSALTIRPPCLPSASENENLLARQENLLVCDDQTDHTFSQALLLFFIYYYMYA